MQVSPRIEPSACRAMRGSRALRACTLLALLWLAGCTRHLALHAPDTSPGARYRCGVVDGSGKHTCRPATTDVPAELNQSGTRHVVLPAECRGRIQRIVILNADSTQPTLDVTCAPEERPLEEMQ